MERFIFSQKEKKLVRYLPLLLIVFVFAIISSWGYVKFGKKSSLTTPPSQTPSQDSAVQKQLRELEMLRGESATLTEKEIQSQLKDLETLRKKTKPQSQEQTQQQLEELEKLRPQ